MREPLPLATIQNAVLEFLRGRDDVVVFGAQAVNAYVSEPRMTQDIDLLSPHAVAFVQELRDYLSKQFHIAVRVQKIAPPRPRGGPKTLPLGPPAGGGAGEGIGCIRFRGPATATSLT